MTINASVMTTPDTPATKRNPSKQHYYEKKKHVLILMILSFMLWMQIKRNPYSLLRGLRKCFFKQ